MPENSTFRVLDANLNRAREAARVIEDYARFAMGDRAAAETAKGLRHELAAAFSKYSPTWLTGRDVAGDVGLDIKLSTEGSRESLASVVAAEFARLGESLRVLGEVGKLAAPDAATVAEKLRYRAYELEQVLRLRGDRRARFAAVRLYVIITESLCRPLQDGRRDWYDVASAALRGGATCIQLREKSLPDAEWLRRADALRRLTREAGALLIINDRPDIARLCDADGVHVGQDDLSIEHVRRIVGADRLVGISTHSREQFEAAIARNPDYVALGPMFATPTKPAAKAVGPLLLRQLAGQTEIPIVAIGGISPSNVAELRAAAPHSIPCVCSSVINAENLQQAAGALISHEIEINR